MFCRESLESSQVSLETSGDPDVLVEADLAILCSSVIGNFITNASKFSPRDSAVRIRSELVGDSVRIAVLDEGPGLPDELLRGGTVTSRRNSTKGTEGEAGTGYGLQIAALCAARMGGRVELGAGADGGGAISVLLPRARPA